MVPRVLALDAVETYTGAAFKYRKLNCKKKHKRKYRYISKPIDNTGIPYSKGAPLAVVGSMFVIWLCSF